MKIQRDTLEAHYTAFVTFLKKKDGEQLGRFIDSPYFHQEENYKYSVYEEARKVLSFSNWDKTYLKENGILGHIVAALEAKPLHNGRPVVNNLINNWRIVDDFKKKYFTKEVEHLLFDFYKGKSIDAQSFEQLLDQGLPYNLIAYLFFLKEKNKYLPISQERFDAIFEMLGIDFKTSGRASWENYTQFLEIIKEVKLFLSEKTKGVQLLDAHSFLWMLGSQMVQDQQSKPNVSNGAFEKVESSELKDENINTTIFTEPVSPSPTSIAEEDESTSFFEGIESYKIHRKLERNREVVELAKRQKKAMDPLLRCEACNFSFFEAYGSLGDGFIEAHHLVPLSTFKEGTMTRIEDLSMLCSNCHRMIHRMGTTTSIEDLKQIINRSKEL